MASTFRLTIRTNSAAFVDAGGAEVARILREIADSVDGLTFPLVVEIKTQSVFDVNGNRVGGWAWNAEA